MKINTRNTSRKTIKSRSRALKLLMLGGLAAILPGLGNAADGQVGTSIFVARSDYDAFNQPYVIAEIPDATYGTPEAGNCRAAYLNNTLKNMPYVVVFPGDTGNFGNTDPGNAARNAHYQSVLTREAIRLANGGTCVRVVAVETSPAYTGYAAYPQTGFIGANLSGSSNINWPMTKGASAIFNITRDIQGNAKYSGAPRWYLHGGSAGAMNVARMVDMLNDSVVSIYAYKIPEAVLLESLPISGDMSLTCANANTGSLVYAIVNRDYQNANACAYAAGNPSAYNYKVLSGNIRNWYVGAKGKRVNVMMGADDLIWKSAYTSSGWTALGNYKNFIGAIGASGCVGSAYALDPSHVTTIYNADMWVDCDGGRIRIRQFQFGGHGPLYNSSVGNHPYGSAEDHLRAWFQ